MEVYYRKSLKINIEDKPYYEHNMTSINKTEPEYREQFLEYIRNGEQVLRKRGYVARIGSDVELVFEKPANPRSNQFLRDKLIKRTQDEIRSDDFIDINQNTVKEYLKKHDIGYDEDKHGDTEKRFNALLKKEAPIDDLLMFYIQEINPRTRNLLEYQYEYYEDNPRIMELRIKHFGAEDWSNHYRTVTQELSALVEEIGNDRGSLMRLGIAWAGTHYHTSMHKVPPNKPLDEVDWDKTNVMIPNNPAWSVEGKRCI